MGNFKSHTHQRNVRLLYLGHTGAGKTGSLASLAAYGYTIRILDLDNQVDILEGYANDTERSIYRKPREGLWTQALADSILDRLEYVTITEQHKLMGTRSVPSGRAWQRISSQLTKWIDGETNHGNITEWDSDTILVVDGLSRLCEAAMNFQLSVNNRLLTGPQVGTAGSNDYTHAYTYITEFLNLLKSDEIKCHIIMICHIKFQEEDTSPTAARKTVKGFPQTIGRMLAPQIGQYFGHALRAKSTEVGLNKDKHTIVTDLDDSVDLKSTRPLAVKREYDLATGLAEYFRDVGFRPSTNPGT